MNLNLLGVSLTNFTPSMISMSLDLAALSSALTVLTNMQLNSAFSCSKQSRFLLSSMLLSSGVGTATADVAKRHSITILFIFCVWSNVLTDNCKENVLKRIEHVARKIFGAKCDLTLRSFYLYRSSPAGTLPNIPTLTDDACDDDKRLRHTRRHRWYMSLPTSPSEETFFNNFLNKRPTTSMDQRSSWSWADLSIGDPWY